MEKSYKLVGVFNVPFQHKYGYIRHERSGVESYPYPVKEGLAAFLFSTHPKRKRDQEAHLNYYASAYKRGDNYHTTRQN